MEESRRIIADAVYGKKTQAFRKIIRVTADEEQKSTEILGCRVCGAKVLGSCIEVDNGAGKKVKAKVNFDIHIWYRTESDTKVAKLSAEFFEHIEVAKQGAETFSHEKADVWIKENPKCLEPIVIGNPEGNQFAVEMEYALEAEVIGEGALSVKVFDT